MALIKCSECGAQVSDKAASCPHCGNPIAAAQVQQAQPQEAKIQPVFESGKIVVCTRCRSQHVQLYEIEHRGQHGAKVKTSYSANLNPLKPFTLVNKKEKVKRKASEGYEVRRYQCLDCGKEFYFNPGIAPNGQQATSCSDLLIMVMVVAVMIWIFYMVIF